MVLNDDEVTEDIRVFERVKFDGDLPKATAIDTALTYAVFAIEEHQRRIVATVSGRIGVPTTNFTAITALLESILHGHGYMIISNESWEELDRGVQDIAERSAKAIQLCDAKDKRLDSLEAELEEAYAKIRNQIDEIDQLKNAAFKVSKCQLPTPYNPLNGEPCLAPHHENPTNPHWSSSGMSSDDWWNVNEGLAEAEARTAKLFPTKTTPQPENEVSKYFVRSECSMVNPYNPKTGDPCIGHSVDCHRSALGSRNPQDWWSPERGISEEGARILKAALKTQNQ